MASDLLSVFQPLEDRTYLTGCQRAGPSTYTSAESSRSASTRRPMSTIESSGNENNKGMTTISLRALADQADSSNLTNTGNGSSTFRDSKLKGSSQHSNRSSSNNSEGSEHLIEEKRKVPNDQNGGFTLHQYQRGQLLGKGGFAKVYLCTALDTNKQYAVKVVPKANLVKARARQKLQAEIKIHRTLKHKHICEYKHFFEDRDNCYILLELCHNQSMNELIKRRKRLTEPEAAFFMVQLLLAVSHMHENNVIHRDLKLGNLFVDRNVHIKVGDFGLATRVHSRDEKRKTICGTPNYIAPEIIQGDKSKRGHSFEVDVWSIGVILYTLLIGKPPYEAKDVKATYQRILRNEYSFPAHIPISDNAKNLIQSMLVLDPEQRPSLVDIQKHPFLNHQIPLELPTSMLHFAPVWQENEFREVVAGDDNRTAVEVRKKSSSTIGARKPFGYRDPNSKSTTSSTTSNYALASKGDPRGLDMQRIVRSALVMAGGDAVSTTKTPAYEPDLETEPPTYKSKFKVFDETIGNALFESTTASLHRPPTAPSCILNDEVLLRRTKALTFTEKTDSSLRSSDYLRSQSITSTASSAFGDGELLLRLSERLETVLDITESRRGLYSKTMPQPVSMSAAPVKWVTRYVDYTSKYGLGYLLNDGTSGVYFNDSTKAALEADGEAFQYIERKKVDEVDNSNRRIETAVESHTLLIYPDSLKKKVTLLKHFRSYLLEQQQEDNSEKLLPMVQSFGATQPNLIYVRKWVRTKHAILFWLSNLTVQVVFYDHSEILLTADDRYITYVNKQLKRSTFFFTDELVGSSSEIEKRLKYAKEIVGQLVVKR